MSTFSQLYPNLAKEMARCRREETGPSAVRRLAKPRHDFSDDFRYMSAEGTPTPSWLKDSAPADADFADHQPSRDDVEVFSVADTTAPTPKLQTWLDAVDQYKAAHGYYAATGVTLLDHVNDFQINTPKSPEMTPAAFEAVKRESEQLTQKWMAGEVERPW